MSTIKEEMRSRIFGKTGSAYRDRQEQAAQGRTSYEGTAIKLDTYLVFYTVNAKLKPSPQIIKLPVA